MIRRQSGFAYIAAVVFLVLIAGISATLLRLTDTQQGTVNQAVLAARASLAARAGIEWVFSSPATRCAEASTPATPTTLGDFRAESGFQVTVSCSYQIYNEGEQEVQNGAATVYLPLKKRVYRVEAVACNGNGAACPDAASVTRPDYVERARVATMCTLDGAAGFCA